MLKMINNESSVIQTQGLTKTYGGVPVLNSLDLNATQDSIFDFLGSNRAGKTTTMKLLLGLIKPSSEVAQFLVMILLVQVLRFDPKLVI
jgi:ABC-2 type transport system ATP-binding protein